MNAGKLWAGIFLSCLLGTGIPLGIGLTLLNNRLKASSVAEPPPPAKPKAVYPAVLTGRPSIELGDFILSAMPNQDGSDGEDGHSGGWPWRWQSEAGHIAWSAELDPNSDTTDRVGVMRLNVLGEVATVLRETQQELGWDVSLSTSGNPSFGPQKIGFAPQDCFGFMNDSCTFETLPSLEKAGIAAHLQCQQRSFHGENVTYLLQHPDKKDVLLSWDVNGGSGGYSQNWWVEPVSEEALSNDCGTVTDNFPFDDAELAMAKRNHSDIQRYQTIAHDALGHMAARALDARGHHCTVRVMLDRWRTTPAVMDASRTGNDMVLCDEMLKVLDAVEWSTSLSHTNAVFDVTLDR